MASLARTVASLARTVASLARTVPKPFPTKSVHSPFGVQKSTQRGAKSRVVECL